MTKTETSLGHRASRTAPNSPQRLWRAVAERNPQLDGEFVYGVRSTGIYCRPSCPARRPGREQVRFFDAPEAAEREGFRACRRCRPQLEPLRTEFALIRRLCRAIEAGAGSPLRLATLASGLDISPFRLLRLFRRLLGISPRHYADAIRLRRFKLQLRKGGDVTTALYEAGYSSSSRLYERSDAQLGMTPDTYRRCGRGMVIGYTIAPSPLGRLLVAGTERGISAIYLGDADAPLEAMLQREYPEARIRRDAKQVSSWVRTLIRHLAGRQPRLELPLDIQATAFQRCVWKALQQIPYGSTSSYSAIARKLRQPKATRAVARSCATNPVSVLIPCHRVVRKDGALGGYRWGIARKQALLERERREANERPAPIKNQRAGKPT